MCEDTSGPDGVLDLDGSEEEKEGGGQESKDKDPHTQKAGTQVASSREVAIFIFLSPVPAFSSIFLLRAYVFWINIS